MSLSFLSPQKRPTLFGWIVLGLLILATFAFVKRAFSPLPPHTTDVAVGVAMDASNEQWAYRSGSGSAGMNVAPSIPPMAPAPSPLKEEGGMGMGSGGGSAMPSPLDAPRVIKTGNLSLRVTDVLESVERIRSVAAAQEGFIENSSVSESGGPRYGNITIRVPVANFESTMTTIKNLAVVVLQENVNGQDVNAEFIDLEADIRNAKAEEASYLEILKRSGTIEDILAVTQRLADVRGRLERLEGHKRYLTGRTDFSTITVALTEETRIEVPGRTWKPGEVLREAVRDLVVSLQTLVTVIIRVGIVFLGLAVPLLLLIGACAWIVWRILRAVLRRIRR